MKQARADFRTGRHVLCYLWARLFPQKRASKNFLLLPQEQQKFSNLSLPFICSSFPPLFAEAPTSTDI